MGSHQPGRVSRHHRACAWGDDWRVDVAEADRGGGASGRPPGLRWNCRWWCDLTEAERAASRGELSVHEPELGLDLRVERLSTSRRERPTRTNLASEPR